MRHATRTPKRTRYRVSAATTSTRTIIALIVNSPKGICSTDEEESSPEMLPSELSESAGTCEPLSSTSKSNDTINDLFEIGTNRIPQLNVTGSYFLKCIRQCALLNTGYNRAGPHPCNSGAKTHNEPFARARRYAQRSLAYAYGSNWRRD